MAVTLGYWLLPMTTQAASAVYQETVIGTGSLGQTNFTDELITLTATADPGDVTEYQPETLYFVAAATLTVDIFSVGDAVFTESDGIFSGQAYTAVGFTSYTQHGDILDVEDPPIGSYDLTTSIGPVSGTSIINPGVSFLTSKGDFIINSVMGDTTFQATVVPEPSPLAMLATIGLAGLAGLYRRRAVAGAAR